MKKVFRLMVLFMFLCGCTAKSSHDDGQIDLDLTLLDDSLAYAQLVSIIKEPLNISVKGSG